MAYINQSGSINAHSPNAEEKRTIVSTEVLSTRLMENGCDYSITPWGLPVIYLG